MGSRTRAAIGAAVLAVALGAASPAGAAEGGGCQLDGTAKFTPGLNTTAKPFKYTFSGKLLDCRSSTAGVPTTGTVSAGEPLTIAGKQYATPVPSGNGSCASSTTEGISIVTWADGTRTIVKYATTGVLAAVALQGTVLPSITLTAIPPATGSTTLTTTRYPGATSGGPLAFDPPQPTDCNTSTGVLTAAIHGFLALGSS